WSSDVCSSDLRRCVLPVIMPDHVSPAAAAINSPADCVNTCALDGVILYEPKFVGAVVWKIGPCPVAVSMTIRRTVREHMGLIALLEQIVIVYSISPIRNLQHRHPGKMIEMAMVNSRVCHETSAAVHSNPAVNAYNVYCASPKCDAREPK